MRAPAVMCAPRTFHGRTGSTRRSTEWPTAATSKTDLEQLVAEADIGGRKPSGLAAKAIMAVAVAWSLFQLWYASPLPFMLGFGVFSDTEARCFHLSFALFLAFAAYPAFKSSPRKHVPLLDWALAAAAHRLRALSRRVLSRAGAAARPADRSPTSLVSVVGVALLIEASRRAEGPWMPVISLVDAGLRVSRAPICRA